jgi:DNA-directed RNA polymerase specialized sigma24 family protein
MMKGQPVTEGSRTASTERERLQECIDRLESRIRRRLLGKLRAINHGVYDLDDVIASVRRRVDAAASAGKILARSAIELDAYIFSVAEHVAIQALRRERRQRRRWRRAAEIEIIRVEGPPTGSSLPIAEDILSKFEQEDRAALELWARGLDHSQIAASLSIGLPAHRSRWRRFQSRLRDIVARQE